MTNRRQFIQSGLVMSALSMTEVSALPVGVDAQELTLPELELFVFDNRFKEAVKISHSIGLKDISQVETSGDMTDLWYKQLNHQWQQAPMTLAGVTASDGLFVLKTLSADYGMKVLLQEELGTFAVEGSSQNETLLSWIITPRNSQV